MITSRHANLHSEEQGRVNHNSGEAEVQILWQVKQNKCLFSWGPFFKYCKPEKLQKTKDITLLIMKQPFSRRPNEDYGVSWS